MSAVAPVRDPQGKDIAATLSIRIYNDGTAVGAVHYNQDGNHLTSVDYPLTPGMCAGIVDQISENAPAGHIFSAPAAMAGDVDAANAEVAAAEQALADAKTHQAAALDAQKAAANQSGAGTTFHGIAAIYHSPTGDIPVTVLGPAPDGQDGRKFRFIEGQAEPVAEDLLTPSEPVVN